MTPFSTNGVASNPRVVHGQMSRWLSKTNIGNSAAVFFPQMRRGFYNGSVSFSNSPLYSRQQCFFLKSGTAFAAAVLLFQRRQEFTNLINVCERFRAKA